MHHVLQLKETIGIERRKKKKEKEETLRFDYELIKFSERMSESEKVKLVNLLPELTILSMVDRKVLNLQSDQ